VTWRRGGDSNPAKTAIFPGIQSAYTQIDTQNNPEIKEIVAAWPTLSDALKGAVLAIVRTVGHGKEKL
jgi:hypothetical protein